MDKIGIELVLFWLVVFFLIGAAFGLGFDLSEAFLRWTNILR
jgi:hypothetical protein